MSDLVKLGQTDFIREAHRLQARVTAAIVSGDDEQIETAVHDMALFLRYNAAGRLQDYFASQQTRTAE